MQQIQVPVTNTGRGLMYIGSAIIAPGETRHFYPDELPPHLRPRDPADPDPRPEPPELEAVLLTGTVGTIVKALPDLSDAQLDHLGELEQLAPNPRKGVLSAVAEELLKRGAQKVDGNGASDAGQDAPADPANAAGEQSQQPDQQA
ncbi:hypothetical protein IGB42_02638 [Andreprevotia sp. IGB-42]|uniref:hypothetical protein n=1 Tax=Andreprevotia sp. IGB-42 TaxID=2497473 RepID=UPI0013578342|nr:hypothetical protein [Andreprevotia sp. IGB-42]KAF0812795.1 hypothetical protein IGB42_02638 [Andreprevotia sp. IGB-42]